MTSPDPQHNDAADNYAAETDNPADFVTDSSSPADEETDPGELPSELPDAPEEEIGR
jgi:hypothetical protein